jgi:dolichol-phosphate mannosyltransferase
MSRLSIVVPTYNERENLFPLTQRIHDALQDLAVEWEILVVDDSSPDGTAVEAKELAHRHPLRVLVRRDKKGLSRSVLEGFREAHGDFLLVMDADLSHPPEAIPVMWETMIDQECDLVVGSRYVPGGRIEGWPFVRRLTSRISKLMAMPLTEVKDPLAGFFLVRKSVVEERPFNPAGFKILLEILVKGRHGKVREVPITFRDRVRGTSKLTHGVVLAYLIQLVALYAGRTIAHTRCSGRRCLE